MAAVTTQEPDANKIASGCVKKPIDQTIQLVRPKKLFSKELYFLATCNVSTNMKLVAHVLISAVNRTCHYDYKCYTQRTISIIAIVFHIQVVNLGF